MAAAPVWSVDPRTGKQREQVAVEATAQEVDAGRPRRARRARPRSPTAPCAPRSCAPPPTCSEAREGPPRRGRRRRDRARPGPADRRTRPHQLPVARLRRHRRRGRLPRRRHRPPRRRPRPRRCPDLRRYKVPLGVVAVYSASNFPLRLLRPRRRHRERAGRGLPGRRQGAPRPPGHLRAGRLRAAPGRRRGTASPRASSAWCTASRRASSWSGTRWSPPPGSPARSAAAAPCSTRRPPGPCRSPSTASWAPSTPSWSREAAAAERAEADRRRASPAR